MNIFQIKQELQNIFEVLEENGGELTPELAEQLAIAQDEFKDKIETYTNAIKLFEGDIVLIKNEQKRLKDIADKKQKTIDRLKAVILEAIEQFGDTKKSGVKYIDYGTGEVSIRTTKSVQVDDALLDRIGNIITANVRYIKEINQLDVEQSLNIDDIIKMLNDVAIVTKDDIQHTNLNLSVNIPTSSVFDGSGYNILKEMAKYTSNFELTSTVSKTELKKELEENGSCTPCLAKLNTNKSIQIK